MIPKFKNYGVLFLLVFGYTVLHAQNAVTSSGGIATGSGGSASYSVGQVFFNTNYGVNGTVTPGVLQPYEISMVTNMEDANNISFDCNVYPNPGSEVLKLKIDIRNRENISFQLYDIQGKLILNKKVEDVETSISIKSLPPSTYLLKVTYYQKEIKVFKVIKN